MALSTPPRFELHLPWSVSLKEAGLLLVVSMLATGGWWLSSGARLPLQADSTVYELELEAPLLSVTEALTFYDEGVHLFVDTRDETAGQTIPGSLFIRAATFDDDLLENFDFMFPEDALILFGNGNLTRTSNIAARLKARGYENLHILQGGLSGWQSGGGDISVTDQSITDESVTDQGAGS